MCKSKSRKFFLAFLILPLESSNIYISKQKIDNKYKSQRIEPHHFRAQQSYLSLSTLSTRGRHSCVHEKRGLNLSRGGTMRVTLSALTWKPVKTSTERKRARKRLNPFPSPLLFTLQLSKRGGSRKGREREGADRGQKFEKKKFRGLADFRMTEQEEGGEELSRFS